MCLISNLPFLNYFILAKEVVKATAPFLVEQASHEAALYDVAPNDGGSEGTV
mgnify:CR=1 FL=1